MFLCNTIFYNLYNKLYKIPNTLGILKKIIEFTFNILND